jgi:hypothetical protein
MAESSPARRALIVDDEYLIAFDLEASMRELGFDACVVASNENDAIELAKSNPPDGGDGCISRRSSCWNRGGEMAPGSVWHASCFCDRAL